MLVSCSIANEGCNGGYANQAWLFMEINGIVTLECYPYTSGNGTNG